MKPLTITSMSTFRPLRPPIQHERYLRQNHRFAGLVQTELNIKRHARNGVKKNPGNGPRHDEKVVGKGIEDGRTEN